MRIKLTSENVMRLKPEGTKAKADAIFWDSEKPGLGLRIQGEKRTFVAQYRALGGKTRRMTIGAVEKIGLAEARKEASKMFAAVTQGGDPAEAKQERIAARRAKANAPKPLTLGEAVEMFLDGRDGYWGRQYLRDHFSPLHKVPLAEVNLTAVAARLTDIAKQRGGFASNRARQTLNAMYSWLLSKGLATSNPVTGTRPEVKEADYGGRGY